MSISVTEDVLKTILQTQILSILKTTDGALEELVKSALMGKVDDNGKPTSYGSGTKYIDYIVQQTIRDAADKAVKEVIAEYASRIKELIKEKFTVDTLADIMVGSFIKNTEEDWRIMVKFEKNERRY